ncbi:helix-turn-helix domain-containing protein [Flavobacterium chilense]|uniref:AraC-type DNA-binding protein n=1 Tax=Flavobacterium chilense TaxID=946677 RepID=A0A1M7M0I0_9FLAO|nr:AraC family transcriptional regulator [Flavobacterium chilense]SHM84178.1 AraC-type DNA-binding protein [Flavobacterium chilense]
MKRITHYYSLTPEWMQEIADQLKVKIIDKKIIPIPKEIGQGQFYFTQIMPGISVVFIDFILTKPLKIMRRKSEEQLYVFHFDLSEHTNLIKINNKNYEIGSYDKLDLAIIDNVIESSFEPVTNEKTIAIRILVDKKFLSDFIAKYSNKVLLKTKTNSGKKTFFHYGHTDSNSVLLIQSIKNKSVHDLPFDSLLKGVSLKLLGNFFNKFYEMETKKGEIMTEADNESIFKTKLYLLNNLYGPFPSVTFLAAMAGMSESKFKMLFKKCYGKTPQNFFITEKMKLGQTLLASGEFHSLTEVIYELNYSKLSYFSAKYLKFFKKKPADDFIKSKLRVSENAY